MRNKRMSSARSLKRGHLILKHTDTKEAMVSGDNIEVEEKVGTKIHTLYRRGKRGQLTVVEDEIIL